MSLAEIAVATNSYILLPLMNPTGCVPTRNQAKQSINYTIRLTIVNDYIEINTDRNNTELVQISILDILGKNILNLNSINAYPLRINIDNLAKGIYICTVLQKNGYFWSAKFVK